MLGFHAARGGSAIRLLLTAMAAGFIGCSDQTGPSQPPATATVSGLVLDAGTRAPVDGALVTLGAAAVTTGEDGRFAIVGVPVGAALSMTVSRNGFETYAHTIAVLAQSKEHLVLLVRNHIYVSGTTTAYLPPAVARLRGALVVLPGSGGDMRPFITAEREGGPYAGLAEKHGLALVGAAAGTGVQLRALEAIALESGRPELATAPLLLAGYSEGACFAFRSSIENAERIIGALVMKAAWTTCAASGELDAAPLRAVPVYILVGEFENPPVPTALFEEHRAEGAVWAIAVQKGKGHEAPGPDDDPWIIEWLDAVLTYRLPGGDASGTAATLRPIPVASGWLGDRFSLAIARHDCYAGDALAASWLPSERSARQWQSIVSAGGVSAVLDCP
jgi:hypothetical protein